MQTDLFNYNHLERKSLRKILYEAVAQPSLLHMTISACTMVVAWMLFSSIGIGIARYQKKMLKEKEVFGAKIWFQVIVREQLYSKCSLRDISLDMRSEIRYY